MGPEQDLKTSSMPRRQANVTPVTGRTFIRNKRVREMTGLPNSSLYDLIVRGEFPKPVPLSDRRVAWLLDEIDAWIEARIAERDQKSASPKQVQHGAGQDQAGGVRRPRGR
jgi:prophage regulatory protein